MRSAVVASVDWFVISVRGTTMTVLEKDRDLNVIVVHWNWEVWEGEVVLPSCAH